MICDSDMWWWYAKMRWWYVIVIRGGDMWFWYVVMICEDDMLCDVAVILMIFDV